MERIDFIKEKILTIEDYEKVDETLMSEINSNPEYLHLFDECKSLSKLLGKSVPSPTQNGVTLSDSVMQRIKSGDTAPKYINHSIRFPFATVACLVVVCAVVLTSRYMPEKYNSDAEAQYNMAAESYSDEEMISDTKLTKAKSTSEAFDETVPECETDIDDTIPFSQHSFDYVSNYSCYDYKIASDEPQSEENAIVNGAVSESATKLEKPLESFSYEKEAEVYKKDTTGVINDGFRNVSEILITNKAEAELLAKNECTIPYDTIKIYFDTKKEIWKVVFSTEGTLGNCQTVYLDKFGITQLIVYGE